MLHAFWHILAAAATSMLFYVPAAASSAEPAVRYILD